MIIALQAFIDIGVSIAIVALIFELIIAFLVSKQYSNARNKLISRQQFESMLQNGINNEKDTIFDNLMVAELIDLMGAQGAVESVRNVLRKHLTLYNENIRHLANMGPAIGLFFTFTGMFLTVIEMSTTPFDKNIDIISQNFSNLYPIFVGGAVGILIYGIGMSLLNILQRKQDILENELLKTFLIFESTYEPPKPKTVEDAYKRLLRPLTQLLHRLESINIKFTELTNQTDRLIINFSEKTNNFIDNFAQKTSDLSAKLNSNFSQLESSTKRIADLNSIFTESAKQWEKSAISLTEFALTIVRTEEQLRQLAAISATISDLIKSLELNSNNISASISDLIKSLELNYNNINKLVNWVEQDRLEFESLKDKIEKFVGNIADFKNTVEQFNLGLTPIKDTFDSKLSEIKKMLEEILKTPNPPLEFQKDVKKILEEINIKLNHSEQQKNLVATISEIKNKLEGIVNSPVEFQRDVLKYLGEINQKLNTQSLKGSFDTKLQGNKSSQAAEPQTSNPRSDTSKNLSGSNKLNDNSPDKFSKTEQRSRGSTFDAAENHSNLPKQRKNYIQKFLDLLTNFLTKRK